MGSLDKIVIIIIIIIIIVAVVVLIVIAIAVVTIVLVIRPISILPILSKIYEKHIYDSLHMHLSFNELLYGLQSDFQRLHSTETALVRILDQIHYNLDKNNITGLLYIDYS